MKTELVISASSDQADIALLEDGRLQESCNECEGRIYQLRIAQRSSYYCKNCQL